MLARGEANEVSATPGTQTEESSSPVGATEPSPSVLSPFQGFILFRVGSQGCARRLAPPRANVGRPSGAEDKTNKHDSLNQL